MFANLTSPGITKELDQLWGECLVCSHHRKQAKDKIFFFQFQVKVTIGP